MGKSAYYFCSGLSYTATEGTPELVKNITAQIPRAPCCSLLVLKNQALNEGKDIAFINYIGEDLMAAGWVSFCTWPGLG